MIKRLVLLLALCPLLSGASLKNQIIIKLASRQVCSLKLDECFPIAIGSAQYPSPTDPGPHYVLRHHKNGFDWINPLTGRLYEKGTHNLGSIWITVMVDNSNGWEYGFHQSPQLNVPISNQFSHGCFRLMPDHINKLSESVDYFDPIYIYEKE